MPYSKQVKAINLTSLERQYDFEMLQTRADGWVGIITAFNKRQICCTEFGSVDISTPAELLDGNNELLLTSVSHPSTGDGQSTYDLLHPSVSAKIIN